MRFQTPHRSRQSMVHLIILRIILLIYGIQLTNIPASRESAVASVQAMVALEVNLPANKLLIFYAS